MWGVYLDSITLKLPLHLLQGKMLNDITKGYKDAGGDARNLQVEEAGSEITYPCINSRTCKTCKDHDQIEKTNIKEEIEPDMINQSVHVGLKQRHTIANLPLMHDPAIKLY